jgi:hypothetical protein
MYYGKNFAHRLAQLVTCTCTTLYSTRTCTEVNMYESTKVVILYFRKYESTFESTKVPPKVGGQFSWQRDFK